MRVPKLASIAVVFGWRLFSQSAATSPTFDVASVRPYNERDTGPTGTDGGPGTRDPERFSGRGGSLRFYLCVAVDASDCQEQISGPRWIDDKYDLVANVPPGTTKDQFQKMLQNLLVERFKLVLHHETKTLPVYELVLAKNGPKLKPSVDTVDASPPPNSPPTKFEKDPDGFPVLPPGAPGFVAIFGPGRLSHWTAQQQPTSKLADLLSSPNAAARHVIDRTGLTGKYDFKLAYEMHVPGAPAPDDTPTLILEDALEKQLGLRLVNGKAPFDFVIIERGEKVPTEN
jgi:uncharacterized protein (TIGR03435 family)